MNKIFIIGNGFDLNLGFKTSYLDYVNSDEFRFMNTNNSSNELAKYLMRRVEIQKWVDFEVALKEYVLETRPNSNKLRIEYNEVVKGLESYLNKINTDTINLTSKSYEFAKMIVNDIQSQNVITIVNFNYTNSLETVLKRACEDVSSLIKYPHGKLDKGNENIVLGIEDIPSLDKEYYFIKKSSNGKFRGIGQWVQAISKCDEIYIFGHSLGVSDELYFKPLFDMFINNPHIPKKIQIHNKDLGDGEYINRLYVLTNNNLGSLKNNHVFSLIEVTK